MYLNFMRVCLGLIFCGLLHQSINAQYATPSLSISPFVEIESSGVIPDDFLVSWSDKLDKQLSNESKDASDELELFWTRNHNFIDGLLQSGTILFNDPFSKYLNAIKDELLKDEPALSEEIRIYTRKDPSCNAFTVADGIIIFNIGMFTYVKSEAELAFVLAHEIQHYKQQHLFSAFQEKEALLEESVREYRDLHPIKKFELLIQQSKEYEYEADELGLSLFYKSRYNTSAPIDLLTVLHKSYLPPVYDAKVNKDFISSGQYPIPHTFFRSSVKQISNEEDYFDETHSHPNIFKRKIALDPFLKPENQGEKFIVSSEADFKQLQNYAHFERINELVNYGLYSDALYDIYVQQAVYPNNKFLQLQELKCLYGISSFKAIDKSYLVSKPTGKVEGEWQQVHHVIKGLNAVQMVSYSLHKVLELQKTLPQEGILEFYANQLSRYLVVHCNQKSEDFQTASAVMKPFDKSVSEFKSKRKFLRAEQKHNDEFYKYTLHEYYKSGRLVELMRPHFAERDSISDYINMSSDDKEDVNDALAEKRERGANLHLDKLIVLDPVINVIGSNDDADEIQEGLEEEKEFKAMLPKLFSDAGIQAQLLYSENLTPKDVSTYNMYARLKTNISQAIRFEKYDLVPPLAGSKHLADKYICPNVCVINGYVVDRKQDYYVFGVYNLKKGKFVYSYVDDKGYTLSLKDLEKETIKNLEKIHN